MLFRVDVNFGDVFLGEGFEFAADEVGGEAGAEEGRVEGNAFTVVDFAAKRPKFSLYSLADDGGLVALLGGFGECRVDVTVGNAAGAEFAGDAELALFAGLRALAGELFGVAGIIKLAGFFESGHDDLDEKFIVGSPGEELFHFVDGMSAAHEGAQSDIIEFRFGFELARLGEHGKKMREGRKEVKSKGKRTEKDNAEARSTRRFTEAERGSRREVIRRWVWHLGGGS
jgi:hypothetical protein